MINKRKKVNKTSNDPISDLLTRIRNGLLLKADTVQIPFSKLKLHLTEILKDEGYINSFKVVDDEQPQFKKIEVGLKYTRAGQSVITGLKRISRPGLRKYSKSKEAPRVFNGLGISIISTSQGLKTDRKARKDNVGGEVLCEVW